MVNADIVFRKLHNNEIDDVPIEEGNVIYDLDTKQIFVDDVVDGVLKRVKYGGSEKLIDAIISANTTTKTIYDDTITTDSIIRVYVDEDDSFTYNSISTASGSVTITFNAMTQDVPIKIGIGAVSEFHQLITEGQASDISYNNGQSGMTATDVQEAIDELKSDLGNIELTANNVEYDNVTSGLQATNVQDAVDEITDNLAQTPITVEGQTLSTIDDKINWIIENTSKVKEAVFMFRRSGHFGGGVLLNAQGLAIYDSSGSTYRQNLESMEVNVNSSSGAIVKAKKAGKFKYSVVSAGSNYAYNGQYGYLEGTFAVGDTIASLTGVGDCGTLSVVYEE